MKQNTIIGLTITLLLIILLAALAWNQRNQAVAQANLATTAQAQLTAQQNGAQITQATLAAEVEASRATATAEVKARATVSPHLSQLASAGGVVNSVIEKKQRLLPPSGPPG